MARTVNAPIHAVRRDAFVDAAQRLIQDKGYEQMSVQDVLDQLDASRGALYHYFDSKEALLEAVVTRMVDGALESVAPLVSDPRLSALEKLAGVFGGIATFKNQRKELLLALIEVWLSDDNAIVREKFRREVTARLTPMLVSVIEQGVAEGTFSAQRPEYTAQVFVTLLLGTNEVATRLFLANQAGQVTFEQAEEILATFGDGFERLLGASPGTLPLVDSSILREWFV
jgi:AcrR family transcriptional regulator